MRTFGKPSSEQGVVIMVSLILLVVMTTMGVGLVYTTGRNDQGASQKINHSQALHASETCIQNIMRLMKEHGAPCKDSQNGQRCGAIKTVEKTMAEYDFFNRQDKHKNKMTHHKYHCYVTLIAKDDVDNDPGGDVGQGDEYEVGTSTKKYIYKIRAESKDTTKSANIEVVASMIF